MSEDKTAEEIWASFCDEYKHIPKDEMDDETRETMFSSFMDGWRAAEKSQADLERRLGIAVERLESISSAPGSYPRQWFIATAEYTLNEIRAKEGDEG